MPCVLKYLHLLLLCGEENLLSLGCQFSPIAAEREVLKSSRTLQGHILQKGKAGCGGWRLSLVLDFVEIQAGEGLRVPASPGGQGLCL